MKGFIFAAGLGTRLKPLTDTMPKALVPVAGKPLIHHLILKMKAAGIDDVVVNVHHFADAVEAYVREQNDFGIRVRFSDERDLLLETGGGLLHARELLGGGPFLAHNVDILTNIDLRTFIDAATGGGQEPLASLLVSDRPTRRYFLFGQDGRLDGWTDISTGEVRSPEEGLDISGLTKLAFAGVHLISGDIFKVMEEDGWSGRFSITDFYVRECGRHCVKGLCIPGLKILDVGKTDSLKEAEIFANQFLKL